MVTRGERRTLPLDRVRADGWFERLAQSGPSFDQLCDILGERFVAFTAIADVRVTAVTLDRQRPAASLVDFQIGDAPSQHRLPLHELRRRVALAMLSEEPAEDALPDAPSPEAVRSFLGVTTVLLAPLFGIRLHELHLDESAAPSVVVEQDDVREEISLEGLRDRIRERVTDELERVQSPEDALPVDLEAVPEAEGANEAGDWERTIELLGDWPGPLSMLMRTAEGQQLAPSVKGTLARGLGLLGTAYVRTGRSDWAEEIMRLGIQWSQGAAVAGDLFRRLGEAYVAQDRPGEAIAFFRRAVALGAPPAEVLPDLASCFVARGRYVAAAACVDEAAAAGAGTEALDALRGELATRLGSAWERFREHVPAPTAKHSTQPPAGD
ncbi:MAG: hypothetical protein ACOCV4_09065 [Myxococcota bacterium]